MRSKFVLPSLALLLLLAAAAQGQQVKPVAVSPGDALGTDEGLRPSPVWFGKPKDDAGTVNKSAVVAGSSTLPIQLAFDSSAAGLTKPDVVRVDVTGQGVFKDAPTAALKMDGDQGGSFLCQFETRPIEIKLGDKTVPAILKGHYYKSGQYRSLHVSIGTALEAECPFAGKKHVVRLLDGNNNQKFTDPVPPQPGFGRPGAFVTAGDTVAVNLGGEKWTKGFYGQPILVDGKWFGVKLSAEGDKINVEPMNIQAGKVKIASRGLTCTLIGKKCVMAVTDKDAGEYELPADQYTMGQSLIGAMPGSSDKGASLMTYGGSKLTVKPGETVDLPAGPPLAAKVAATSRGREVTFSLQLADRGGNQVVYLADAKGERPAAPKVAVLDAAGKTVYQNTLEYG